MRTEYTRLWLYYLRSSESVHLLIAGSTIDPASRLMMQAVRSQLFTRPASTFGIELVEITTELTSSSVPPLPEAETYIFLSRHKGMKPCFTLHATGNPTSRNDLGGKPRELGIAAPSLALRILRELSKEPIMPVVHEATHHGPTSLAGRALFVEVGSGEEQWSSKPLCEYVARSVVNAITSSYSGVGYACAFGGPHYASKFTEYAMLHSTGLGHIISKHAFTDIDAEVILQAIERSLPRPDKALVDWKGLTSDQRNFLLREFSRLGFPYERI